MVALSHDADLVVEALGTAGVSHGALGLLALNVRWRTSADALEAGEEVILWLVAHEP
jgi:hypothetical protein